MVLAGDSSKTRELVTDLPVPPADIRPGCGAPLRGNFQPETGKARLCRKALLHNLQEILCLAETAGLDSAAVFST